MPSDMPTDPIDVDRARADTPGCELVVHLNHAGTSLAPRPVLDAQIEWLEAEALSGGYELAADRSADNQATYDEVAALIGAHADEIALVENATFAWHQAFWSMPLRPGDRILSCTVEYASSYVSADWVAPDGYEVRADARRFENWESNMSARAGLRAALAYARSWGLDAIAERVTTVAAALRGRLAGIPGVRVHDLGRQRSGIVTFTVDGVAADDVQGRLRRQGINVSVSEPSSTRLDSERRQLPPLIRASVHYVTTDAELDRVTTAVADMAAAPA
jgi:selenocysteine lyase/cysteine desulfurase